MTTTDKLGLVLPDEAEAYNISVFNDNFRRIDANIGSSENLSELLTEDKTSLVNAINEVFQSGGSEVKASIVNAIITADSTIKVSTENTWDEMTAAIIQIAKNWENTDKSNRGLIAAACNTAETTGVATLGLYPSWKNIKTFILEHLTNG